MAKKAEAMRFDDNIYDTIRRNIKKYRKEKGMTAAQLAEAVNLSHDFIRQIGSRKKRIKLCRNSNIRFFAFFCRFCIFPENG